MNAQPETEEIPTHPALRHDGVMMEVLRNFTVVDETNPAYGTTLCIYVGEGQAELEAALAAAEARYLASALKWETVRPGVEMARA